MDVTIRYENRLVSVPKEVADFLESDNRRLAAQGRRDRRHLSKSDFELVSQSLHSTGRHEVEDAAIKHLSLKNLREELSQLTAEERRLLRYRFYDDMTLEQIGKEFGISKMAISKRLNKLLLKMGGSKKLGSLIFFRKLKILLIFWFTNLSELS